MYEGEDYDLAGFCVGIVEKDQIIDGSKVTSGDILLGLASSGPHSNGYSLIRKVIELSEADLNSEFDGETLGQRLLEPTRIYVKSLLALAKEIDIHSLCHVTGGGLLENLPRVMPNHTTANIDANNWTRPAIFNWLQQQGNIEDTEMYRTFNCGIGMVVVVSAEDQQKTIDFLQQQGETVFTLGTIESGSEKTPNVIIR
jgi:phosphoribosylformylglycinamidine cyclo-ligase